jgi:cell division protein FtsB
MTAPPGAEALTRARRADSDRRRQRVEHALELLTAAGEELTVAAVARAARVSRAFLYRHGDLRAQVLERMAAAPPSVPATSAATRVSDASLLAEVVNQRERNQRLARHIAKLEARLSELLGEQVFRASGLGAPDNIEQLHRRVTTLEQDNALLRQEVADLEDELGAARAVNRELLAEINRSS